MQLSALLCATGALLVALAGASRQRRREEASAASAAGLALQEGRQEEALLEESWAPLARWSLPGGNEELPLVPKADEAPEDDEEAGGVEQQLKDVADREARQLGKLRRIHRDVPNKVERDFKALRDTFMPGYRGLTQAEVISNAALVLFGLAVIIVHGRHFYVPDRYDDVTMFGEPHPAVADKPSDGEVAEPDIIVVFHHPNYKYDDNDKKLSSSTLKEPLIDKGPDKDESSSRGGFQLSRYQQLLDHVKSARETARQAEQVDSARPRSSPRAVAQEALARLGRTSMGIIRGTSHAEAPTYYDARLALLQDVYEDASGLGWEVQAFSSIDDDEIYLCMSLRHWSAAERLLQQRSYNLQVQRRVVDALDIEQPAEEPESSPPYLRYDSRTIARLIDEEQDHALNISDRGEFYRKYFDMANGREGDILSSRDRVRLMFQALSSDLNLDGAEHAGLIVTWYPVHNQRWIEELSKQWADPHMLLDPSFSQPIPMVRNYYGSRVAYTMAFIGHWAKMLVPLTVVALSLELVFQALKFMLHVSGVEEWQRRLILGFSVIVAVWARVADNLWAREEAFLQELFDLDDTGSQAVRPSFQGTMEKSEVNLKIKEKQSNKTTDFYTRLFSGSVSIIFCCGVCLMLVAWIEFFSGRLGVLAGACLSIQIVVFSLIFEVVCLKLTEMENHKHQSSYYDSYFWKHCLLNMVNNYTAFFYLSVKQKLQAGGCPAGGCLHAVRMQIMITLCMLTCVGFAKSLVMTSLLVRFKIWKEEHDAKQQNADRELPKLTWPEKQAKLGSFRLQEQVLNDVELIVALGFPILFASIAPGIVPFCLFVFATRMRQLATFLTTLTRRPLPRRQFDTAAQRSVVHALTRAGVLFSATTLVLYNPGFSNTGPLTKLSNVVVFMILMEFVIAITDLIVPRVCERTKILVARRRYVDQEIQWHIAGISERKETKMSSAEHMDKKDWSTVPHFADNVASSPRGPEPAHAD